MGSVNLRFEVAGVPVCCNFLVSDAVDEPMLGIDWLEENNCHWDFVQGKLNIAGREVSRCPASVCIGRCASSRLNAGVRSCSIGLDYL